MSKKSKAAEAATPTAANAPLPTQGGSYIERDGQLLANPEEPAFEEHPGKTELARREAARKTADATTQE